MTQPANVIYLPPGVVPTVPHPQTATPSGIPFDRTFFEKILPGSIKGFCDQVTCDIPRVEITTIDGAVYFVNGISGLSDSWVALHTSRPEHEHPIQVFLAYATIFRIEIHAESDGPRRRLGFIGDTDPAAIPTVPSLPPASKQGKTGTTAKK